MARPNDAAAIGEYVQGLREAKAAFQALPEIVRDRMLAATETTVREIARVAQAKLLSSPSVRSRALYNHIAWKVTKTNGRGRVGVTTGTTTFRSAPGLKKIRLKGIITTSAGAKKGYVVVQPTRYAHMVEFGTRHMKAEPFMLPATESEKGPFVDRCVRAGKDVERDAASIGGGTL